MLDDLPFQLPLLTAFGDPVDLRRAHLVAASALGMVHAVSKATDAEVIDFDDLVTDAATVSSERSLSKSTQWSVLLAGPEWRLLVSRDDAVCSFHAVATTAHAAEDVVCRYAAKLRPRETATRPDDVVLDFCHLASRGIRRTRRAVTCPPWSSIASNYPDSAATALTELMSTTEPDTGRMVLLWGEPGTGKTTAVRALARQWAQWCRTVYVLDPEALFGSSEYFHNLLLDGTDDLSDLDAFELVAKDREPSPQWRLVVIEDADEVIRADAKQRTGQALARLLNLTDGIVGQGLRTIVLVTTNEQITDLHPALTRPGRCLANIEIGPLAAAEANRWLAARGAAATTGEATLAELYARLGDTAPVTVRSAEPDRTGYL